MRLGHYKFMRKIIKIHTKDLKKKDLIDLLFFFFFFWIRIELSQASIENIVLLLFKYQSQSNKFIWNVAVTTYYRSIGNRLSIMYTISSSYMFSMLVALN